MALLFGAAAQAQAAPQLFAPENYNAWVDVRAVTVDGDTSWLDGGFGKLRYGKGDAGVHVAQGAVLWKPRLADTVTAYVVLQDVPGVDHPLGIEEAYLKWKPVPKANLRYSFRFGQFFPPVSMEHDGVGWTPLRTLTPSAIDSWIGEEVLVQGLEANIQRNFGDHVLGLTLGGFRKDDTAGTILAWRGWGLHDISSSENTTLPLPAGDNQGWTQIFGAYQAPASRPVDDVDGRLGYYARIDWRPPAPMAFNLEYYDNQGNPTAVRNAQWGWGTRFYNLGYQAQLNAKTELLAQYMRGHTRMGWNLGDGTWAIDADFESAYVLVSHTFDTPGFLGGSRLTGRVETFAVKDNSMRDIDDNADRGTSATVAWIKPVNPHLDLTVEAVTVMSNHPARALQMVDPRQTQSMLQVALKLHF
ncbi:MAG: hypothetical protein WDN06_22780 [Asticcacaulis sp.]